jgi:hypothetical protein
MRYCLTRFIAMEYSSELLTKRDKIIVIIIITIILQSMPDRKSPI